MSQVVLPAEGMTNVECYTTTWLSTVTSWMNCPNKGFSRRGQFVDYPIGQSAEYYYKMIKEDEQFQNQDEGEGQGEGGEGQGQSGGSGMPDSLDDHTGWGGESDMDEQTKQAMREVAEQRLKDAMKDAVDEINSSGRGWGTIGASTRKAIQDFITPKGRLA